MAATGPYDAIFSTRTCEDRDVASELDPLLLALLLRRLLLRCRFSTFCHCCPPSHGSWRCRISARRESKRTAFHLLQHNEKSSVPLKEVCTRRSIRVRLLAIWRSSPVCKTHAADFRAKTTAESDELQNKRQNRHFYAMQALAVLSILRPEQPAALVGAGHRARRDANYSQAEIFLHRRRWKTSRPA